MEKLIAYLNSVHGISPELRAYLKTNIKWKKLSKKDFLLIPGQVSRYMCFISKGLLRAYYLKDGLEVSTWFMKEGDVCVSIESFYQQKESYEYIQAIEETEFFYVDYTELHNMYNLFPEFNTIGRILTIKYLNIWAQQLYAIRMQSAAERYHWILNNDPELLQRVPQKYVASYLDITAETLSKIKSEKHVPNQKPYL